MRSKLFEHFFEQAKIAQLKPEDRKAYENDLKYYRDLKNVIDTAIDEGKAEGLAEGLANDCEEGEKQGKLAVARKMLAQDMDHTLIARITDLSLEVLARLS